MRKFTLLLLAVLFMQLQSYAQNTQEQIKVFQTQLDRITVLLTKDSIDIAKGELADLKSNLSKFKAFEEAAVFEVKTQLESEKKKFSDELGKLKLQVSDLEGKLKAAKQGNEAEALKVVEGILEKRNEQQLKIDELNELNSELVNKRDELIAQNTLLQVKLATTEKEKENFVEKHTNVNNELNKFKSAVKVGLSMGFNTYWNNQRDYIVQQDSLAKEIGNGNGASGIISGVVSIRLSKSENSTQHFVVVNVPLGDFTNSSDRAIGLFNNRTAVGLGFAIAPFAEVPFLSFTGIFNMSPFEKIDYNSIDGKKINLPEFTKLKPEEFGATSDISYSVTIGIVYSFINVGTKK